MVSIVLHHTTGDRGGALEAGLSLATLDVSGGAFRSNRAGSTGGAISTEALFDTFIRNTEISSNVAVGDGGGFSANATVQNPGADGLLFEDVIFLNNTSSSGNGGAVALFDKVDGFANFTRCTFDRNRADNMMFDGKGGAIFVDQVNAGTHAQCSFIVPMNRVIVSYLHVHVLLCVFIEMH